MKPRTESFKQVIEKHLFRVAPELKSKGVDVTDNFSTDLGLDSMDIYTMLVEISDELNIDITEDVYGDLRTIKSVNDYLQQMCE